MKLYATVTSERASKGQGGNDRLDIAITVENPYTGERETLTNIEVYPMKYKHSTSYVVDNGGDEWIASRTFHDTKLKGEK